MRRRGEGLPATAADVTVDIDLGVVLHAYWYDPGPWGREAGDLTARLSEDECRSRARAFAEEYCPYFGEHDQLTRTREWEDYGVPCYTFYWEGAGPGDRDHWVNATVSAITGNLVDYTFGMRAPQPPATSPVRITPEQAVEIVRRNLPENLRPTRIEVARLWTRTVYAPPGEPVYMVHVEGRIPMEGGPAESHWFGRVFGVHATTGEVLTEPWEWAFEGPDSYTDKLSPQLRSQVKLTGKEALSTVREHLRDDMEKPRTEVVELTAESHFAPAGEPVYVVRITFDTEDSEGKPTRGTVSWGVHATTGEVIRSRAYD
jgi:hypothetical protein